MLPQEIIRRKRDGEVGDKVSLMLAPMVAACGGYVPMISGRGLGHTGGTFDKLGAIPGYRATPDLDTLRRVVRDVGCAIIGQTGELAPADKRFYAVGDVTATVESIPLICASILSKKLAAGLQGLAIDVKCGSGAIAGMNAREVGVGTDVGAGVSLSLFAAMSDAYMVCQARQLSLDALKLFYLATLGGACTLGLDDRIGNFETGKEADFIVLDAKYLPLLARRLAHLTSLEERLFALAMLADDRAVARTYVAGAPAYARD
jgi:hypothetical protein